jgi:hypothetical protein
MPYVSIDQIKPGMVLAADVLDTNGRMLLSKGKGIEANHINIFKMWGVTEVSAVAHGDGSPAETDVPCLPGWLTALVGSSTGR